MVKGRARSCRWSWWEGLGMRCACAGRPAALRPLSSSRTTQAWLLVSVAPAVTRLLPPDPFLGTVFIFSKVHVPEPQ